MIQMLWHHQSLDATGSLIQTMPGRLKTSVQLLSEARKLQVIDTSMAKKLAPLAQWAKDVSAHLKSNEMDSVFYTVKSNQGMDLLNHWSQMDTNEVTESGRESCLLSKVMMLGP